MMEKPHNSSEKINDFIFKELIKRGYALDGNTRVWNLADSKIMYVTPEQAQSFLDLENSEDYQKEVIQKEIDLINGSIDKILKKTGTDPINIIDLGCGDGKKAVLFIKNFKDKMKLRYCPIDISDYMVEKALKNIRSLDVEEAVGFQWNISDFENIENISSLIRKQGDMKKNFFLLLGNTVGNFEINEILYAIKSSMRKGDLVLIGNGLDNRNTEEILKSYNNQEVNDFLIQIPLQLGLEKEDLEFGVRFVNSRVELFYTIKKDKTIEFQDKKINFSEGDQLTVSVSYKYAKEDFKNYLDLYFSEVDISASKDGSYALALCGL